MFCSHLINWIALLVTKNRLENIIVLLKREYFARTGKQFNGINCFANMTLNNLSHILNSNIWRIDYYEYTYGTLAYL